MSLMNRLNPNHSIPRAVLPAAKATAKPAPAPADAARLLKPEDVAARLGVSERTLERWRREGTGPAFLSLTSKTVRYSDSAVDAFVAGAVRQNTAQA